MSINNRRGSDSGTFWRNAEQENKTRKDLVTDDIRRANGLEEKKPGKYRKSPLFSYIIILILFISVSAFGIIYLADDPTEKVLTISFETNGGPEIETMTVNSEDFIELPLNINRDEFQFAGWYLDDNFEHKISTQTLNSFDSDESLTFYAKWIENGLSVNITFDTVGGTPIANQLLQYGSDLDLFRPTKDDEFFGGWYLEPNYQTLVTETPDFSTTLYALWTPMSMQAVGNASQIYLFPYTENDDQNYYLYGGYYLASYETTYKEWYDVRIWAQANGYSFANLGREGSSMNIGATPISDDKPVTSVSFVDIIVWLNALSEMEGLDPVYRTSYIDDSILKSTSNAQYAVARPYNGYSLPSNYEWEMAARWTDTDESDEGYIFTTNRFWIRGNQVSGYIPLSQMTDYAWLVTNSNLVIHGVGQKTPNVLNLYDMIGNVSEFVFYKNPSNLIMIAHRGGDYFDEGLISNIDFIDRYGINSLVGFRIVLKNHSL